MPKPLPRELFQRILRDDQIDRQTLSRCYGLSKACVDFIRPRLSRQVVFRIANSDSSCDVEIDDTRQHSTDDCLGLLLSLQQDLSLAELVKEVSFEHVGDKRTVLSVPTTV